MDLVLTRNSFQAEGIFGQLAVEDGGDLVASTLEHAFNVNGLWLPKVPIGVYSCQRGMHRLLGMTSPFETFQITQVPGATGILFHPGNWDKDSEGCVLLGRSRAGDMIQESRAAFQDFMASQEGLNTFSLI